MARCNHEPGPGYVTCCRRCGAIKEQGQWLPVIVGDMTAGVAAQAATVTDLTATIDQLRGRVIELDAVNAKLRTAGEDSLRAWAMASAPLRRAGLVDNGADEHQVADAIKKLIAERQA